MRSARKTLILTFCLLISALLVCAALSWAQEKKIVKPQERVKIDKTKLAAQLVKSCHWDLDTPISRTPLESGKQAYIWPDDATAFGGTINLLELARDHMQVGDTLYLRPGTYDGLILAMEQRYYNAPDKRIHVIGSGARNTVLRGYVRVGSGSTVKHLTIDNTGSTSDQTSLTVNPLGVTVENVIIKGGRNGILAGNDWQSQHDGPVTINCVTITGVMYNGVMLGDDSGGKAHNSRINRLTISGTGNTGLAIDGDGVVLEEVRLSRIGTNGLWINGSNALVSNSSIFDTNNMGAVIEGDAAVLDGVSFLEIGTGGLDLRGRNNRVANSTFQAVDLYGIGLQGESSTVENVELKSIGTTSNGTGVIVYEEAANYLVKDCTFDSVRIGISIYAGGGRLENNSFSNIYYQNVLDRSSDDSGSTLLRVDDAQGKVIKKLNKESLEARLKQSKTVIDSQPPSVTIDVHGILVFIVGDEIRISAGAEDNVSVSKVSIYVDGRTAASAEGAECSYRETLSDAGMHRCWAVAEDVAGNTGRSETLEFMVHPSSKPGPSLTIKAQPYQPTSQDSVRFIVDADHSAGVESVTIFVGGRAVKTCNTSHCEYEGGPYPAGTLVWKVDARSRDGGVTLGRDNQLVIKAMAVGTGSISGKAYGSGAGSARVFFVALYGPDDLSLYRETKSFDASGRYGFTSLPPGRYRLVVDTKADIAYGAYPNSRTVDCRNQAIQNIDFEIK
jgi:hypothetical protein